MCALLLCLAMVSCKDDRRPLLAEYDAPSGPPKSLRETFDHLRSTHAERQMVAMRPYIDPASRDTTIDMLIAVDELLAANAAVVKAVQLSSPESPPRLLDISSLILDNLELFSRNVTVLGEEENSQAGTGIVHIAITGRDQPVHVEFRKLDGHWVYVPGTGGGAGAIQAFRELTRTLQQIARSVGLSEHMTPEQVVYEYNLRIRPKLQQWGQSMAG